MYVLATNFPLASSRLHINVTLSMQHLDIQKLLDKGLEALSVKETGQLLSRIGLDVFLSAIKERSVSKSQCLYVFTEYWTYLTR